ncbi:MAG: helix-turn-helix domain-containing protein [Clostridia bacterium]|nr:helix-turn-helix domain-containing protein [Clostridia bacterium]
MSWMAYVQKQFEITAFFSSYKFDWDDRYTYKGEYHAPWEIVFVKSGSVECIEDERVYTLQENDLIIHAPMEFHSIRSIKNPSVLITSFIINGELPGELKNGIFALNDKYCTEFTEIFDRIYAFRERGYANAYLGQEAANRLAAFLIRLSNKSSEEQLSLSQTAAEYRKVASVMADNVCENLSLPQIAELCNISVSYIKLLFKKYTRITPMEYYANLRIQHAIILMKNGMSASQIANTMNFSSPNYFSVFFKKHTGELPSQYRKHFK